MKPFRLIRRSKVGLALNMPPWVHPWLLFERVGSCWVFVGAFVQPAEAMRSAMIAIETSDDCRNLAAYKKARDKRAIRLAALVLTIEEGRWWTPAYWQARSHMPAIKQLVDDAELAIYKVKERLNQRYGAMSRDPS